MRKQTLILLALISLASSASSATRYVSDNLHTFIHSGAGTKYKIVGSVNSGEHITVMKTNKSSGFTLIKDSKGRSGWINSKYISKQLGLKERLPKLEAKLAKLNAQLSNSADKANKDKANLEESVASQGNQVLELQNTNSSLNKELQQVQEENRNLNAILDTQKNDLLMRWFTYGGMVGGIGLLLGLIIPMLMPSRNKKRW